ncbi:MAG: aldo/keto reductase [Microbacterium sp.]|uniref:aldo/keto reductase n=1 Tax=Microbacterium sp. TaxID=51671 RepID=UPI001AD0891D|nr:aldo/keto reductase [Microbacterium sp.]MBN9178680.1 aldo/keto reductase [Microbacterium sp.]
MSPSPIARRPLGPSGPLVPPLALGSWNIWDRMSEDEAVEIIRAAVAGGAGFFDVAYYNMGPHAENSRTDILFGRALRASGVARDDVVLCGKLWLWDWPRTGFRAQLEESLERAGLDRFDAVVVGDYRDAPEPERLVEEVGALLDEGLFDVWGINNWVVGDTRAVIDRAAASGVVPPTFAQLKYSIVRRSMAEGQPYRELFEDGMLGLQASDSFEGGVLLGRTPQRKIGADVGGIRERIAAAAPEVARVAAEFEATPAQLATAYCLAYAPTTNVLFGVSRLAQLADNLAAVRLAEQSGAEIRAALAHLWLDDGVAADGTW